MREGEKEMHIKYVQYIVHVHDDLYFVSIADTCKFLCMQTTCKQETRQSKQLHPKTTPFFLKRKNELPWVGLQPTTFCVLGRRSTN